MVVKHWGPLRAMMLSECTRIRSHEGIVAVLRKWICRHVVLAFWHGGGGEIVPNGALRGEYWSCIIAEGVPSVVGRSWRYHVGFQRLIGQVQFVKKGVRRFPIDGQARRGTMVVLRLREIHVLRLVARYPVCVVIWR